MEAKQVQIEKLSASELIEAITNKVSEKLDEQKKKREAEDDPRYISPLEVSEIFCVSVTTIYNWEYKGFFKAFRIGGRKRYLKSEVLEFADKCQVND